MRENKYLQRIKGNLAVEQAMRKSLDTEEQRAREQRAELQAHVRHVKETKRVAQELKDTTEQLKRARKANREAEAVVTAREAIKSWSVWMLGKGKKKGGCAKCQTERFKVLERVRLVAELSPEQRNDWEYFKTSWDREMANGHGEDWAEMFAEIMQHVLDELSAGNRNALSDFMHRETQRVLAHIPVLQVPGAF